MYVNFETAKAITVSGNSTGSPQIGVISADSLRENPNNLNVLLNVTAVSGTSPSLTVEVQWSNDGTNFFSATTPDTFTAITAVGAALKSFTVKALYARLKYTVSGTTPSLTLTADAYAA